MLLLFDHMFECLFKSGKWQIVPQSQQRWIVPRQQVIPTPPTSSACCLTRNSFRPGAVSSLRAFHGFLRRSFPPLPARLLLTSEDGRYAKRLIPADFALFPPQLFNLLPWPLDRTKFLATQSWACSRNHAAYPLIKRMWWSWMQFWQNSYFDATAWVADIELSAQKPFWSVS